jgi:hypothetical protein
VVGKGRARTGGHGDKGGAKTGQGQGDEVVGKGSAKGDGINERVTWVASSARPDIAPNITIGYL